MSIRHIYLLSMHWRSNRGDNSSPVDKSNWISKFCVQLTKQTKRSIGIIFVYHLFQSLQQSAIRTCLWQCKFHSVNLLFLCGNLGINLVSPLLQRAQRLFGLVQSGAKNFFHSRDSGFVRNLDPLGKSICPLSSQTLLQDAHELRVEQIASQFRTILGCLCPRQNPWTMERPRFCDSSMRRLWLQKYALGCITA